MRTSKRVLAGVAAAGLAAGLIPFVGAGAANAASATASIVASEAGVNIVKTSSGASTAFELAVVTVNAAGVADAIAATDTISVAVTSWPGGGTYAAGPTDPVAVRSTQAGAPGQTAIPQPLVNGVYTFWFSSADWSATTAGTYNLQVAVTNATSGASVTKNIPIVVTANGVEPLGTATWVNPTTGVKVNALSGASGAAYNAITATSRLRDSNGYALILSDLTQVTSTLTTAIGTGPSAATTTTGGYTSVSDLGFYTFTSSAGGGTWGTGGTNAFNLTYATSPAVTASIPVTIASTTATATATTLTTTPQIIPTEVECFSANNCEYVVPSGTTSLTFTNTTATTSGTAAWNTLATGGEVVSSAGVAAISAVSGGGVYAVSVGVSADASADDEVVAFSTGGIQTDVLFQDPAPEITTPSPVIAKLGDAVTLVGAVTDQWGRTLAGSTLVSVSSAGGTLYDSKVSTDGKFSLTVPASASPVAAGNVSYTIGATNGAEASSATVTVTYSSTGEVTSLTMVSNPAAVSGQVPALNVPGSGVFDASLSGISTAIVNPATAPTTAPSGTGSVAVVTPTTSPSTSITLTGTDGVYFTTSTSATAAWNVGSSTVTVPSGTSVRVYVTKIGKSTVTAVAGGKTATVDVFGYTSAANARNIELASSTLELAPNTFKTLGMTVTDVFGNPVRGVAVAPTGANPGVNVSAAGSVTLQTTGSTDGAGKFDIVVAAGEATGDALLTAAGTGAQFNTTILGGGVSKYIAQATIKISGSASKSILIVGDRTTVSGKPGIAVDGDTTGFARGDKMVPNVRFPGESAYSVGSARPEVSAAGDFAWQRKTGKKTYVFFTNEAGDVKSNRVIIPAN